MSAPGGEHRGLVDMAVETFLDRTRAVVGMMTSAGGTALGAVPEPVPSAVTHMLVSLRDLLAQAPTLTAEIDVLIEEIHAKRLSITAVVAELGALDHQLEVLERALGPLEAWNRQWDRLQGALVQTLDGAGAAEED